MLIEKDNGDCEKLIKYLDRSKHARWGPECNGPLEKDIFYYVLKNLLHPLSSGIKTSSMYYTYFLQESSDIFSSVTEGGLKLGPKSGWHGLVDAMCYGDIPVQAMRKNKLESKKNGNRPLEWLHDSTSQATATEGKIDISNDNLSQLIATSVVSSFTEYSMSEPKGNPMVPSIMVDGKSFLVCLYDCVKDLLLLSEKIPLIPVDLSGVVMATRLDSAALCTLFAILNHR